MGMLRALLSSSGWIITNKKLCHQIGITETVFLSELISEMDTYTENGTLEDDDWFYASIPKIKKETSLTKDQQLRIVKKLTSLKILKTKLISPKGKISHERHFKINFSIIENMLKNTQWAGNPTINGRERQLAYIY